MTANLENTGRTTAQNAQLALLLEVSSTPKPGNVDREREYPELRFEQFLAGAVGTHAGFAAVADGDPLGPAFERAIAGMSHQTGGNTQFGATLLLTPLVAAAGGGELRPDRASAAVEETTVDDAVAFYRAFEYVDVAVPEPPEGMDALDVRRGGDAEPALRESGLTLEDVMSRSADRDGIAAELTGGFGWTFELARVIERGEGSVTDRAAAAYLALLSRELDTFVVTNHDRETAYEVRRRANEVLDGEESVYRFAEDLVDRGINPGTTADIVAGGLFVALERGLEV
ncbi:MAG: triphosphoribosyl-dephospho-CoA synthetase [halophilic archaeon J07HX64]|jgi:Triphosphoribosyl-dephospho-CoA synthetase|nr:MAG: triphosphoribosyl-dephospho-CoA synthetase [halophilic archaeon J07HX64]